jgi:glycosyltransferase involved in cell wall biosynthesis
MAGPGLSEFDRYLSSQSSMPRLVNLPPFGDEDKRDLLAAATMVVQPSRVESLGLVLMEAWANSKPVGAADIEVSRKLVSDSGGGVVIPFGDYLALAQQIERLIADPQVCRVMGLRGQQAAKAYNGHVLWPRNAEVFEQVVVRSRREVTS